LGRWAFPLT